MSKTFVLITVSLVGCLLGLFSLSEGTSCLAGWALHGNHCYKIFNQTNEFYQAKSLCARHPKGQLVMINNQAESNFVRKLIKNKAHYFGGQYWIGTYSKLLNGRYTYVDDSRMTYTAWNSGEPNNKHGNEACVMMYADTGKWNDDRCGVLKSFICERRT